MKLIRCKTPIIGIKLLMLILFAINSMDISAQRKHESDVDLNKTPPRIIRACCAFGYDLQLWGLPFVTIDQVISTEDLGEHHYMGSKSEGNGTIYTNKGGFIDIGHLRDQIDWTRYLYTKILHSKGKGDVIMSLGNEGGRKNLYLNIPLQLDNNDCILLAGKIAYDLSLWHELSTWFGVSTIPMMSEKYSSFSVEDVYSNLLGIHIGMKTLRSKLSFNQAATETIISTLDSLDVVKTAKETYDAYDVVHNKWFTNEKRLPKTDVVLKRDTDVLTSSHPWIIPHSTDNINDPIILNVPLMDTKGVLLTNFYQFTIDLNNKFPVEELFPGCESRLINQDDFSILLKRVTSDLQVMEKILLAKKK